MNESVVRVLRIGAMNVRFYVDTEEMRAGVVGAVSHLGRFLEYMIRRFNPRIVSNILKNDTPYGDWKNGSFDGAFGQLGNNSFDILLVPAPINEQAQINFKVTDPFTYQTWKFLATSTIPVESNSFLAAWNIYSIEVWMSFFLVLFAFPIISSLSIFNLSNRGRNLFDSGANAFSALLNQPLQLDLSLTKTRFLWIFWVLACFNISVAFTGTLLSKITIPPIPYRIGQVQDLLSFPTLDVYGPLATPLPKILKESSDPTFRALKKQIEERGTAKRLTIGNLFDALSSVIDGQAVVTLPVDLFMEGFQYFNAFEHFGAKFYFSEEPLEQTLFYLTMRRDIDPNMERNIKESVLMYTETGLLSKHIELNTFLGRRCLRDFSTIGTETLALELKSFVLAFTILAIGYASSILLFVFEMIY